MGIIIKYPSRKNAYHNKYAVENVVSYILRKNARAPESDNIWGSNGTYLKSEKGIIKDFYKLKKLYHKEDGVQIKHIIVSFGKRPDLPTGKLRKIIKRIVSFFSTSYQFVYAVHEDTDNYHLHIGINSVDFFGHKINIRNKDQQEFKKYVNDIWKQYSKIDCKRP